MESTEEPMWAARFWAKIRKNEIGCLEWTAAKGHNGYGSFWVAGKMAQSHRVAWELAHGPIADGMQVDHLCHNHACVNVAHLRLATHKQNQENRPGPQRNNVSGYRGVHFEANRWRAQVQHNGKVISVGRYDTPEEAAAAAAAKRAELFTPIPEVSRAAC